MTEDELIPYRPMDLTGARALVLAPHPDDETFGCGGSIVLHRRRGDRVRVVFVTSGERGDWLGGRGADEMRTRREAEAGRALAFLGVDEWEFWRFADRGVAAEGGLVERLIDAIRRFEPDLVYAPAPLDLHPDHRAIAHALRAALRGGKDVRVCWYEVGYAIPVNTLVDTTEVWDAKAQAMEAYQSQLAGPDYRSVCEGLARFRSLTLGAEVKKAEGFRVTDSGVLEADAIWRWQALQNGSAPLSDAPEVSVVVRTKDRPRFLGEALASLAAQTFRDFEVVLVNDGGEDVSDVVREYGSLRVNAVRLDRSVGRGGASNEGVRAARGRFVAYLDDDDLYYPTHLQTLHEFLSEQDQFGAAYTDAHISHYRMNRETLRYERDTPRVEYSEDFDRDLLLYRNHIPNLCLMHRREGWERVGGFDPELPLLEDWDFVLRLAQAYTFHHLPRCTAEYRIRHDGTNLSTQKPWGSTEEMSARLRILRRHWDKRTPEAEARVYGRLLEDTWNRREEQRGHEAVSKRGEALAVQNDELALRNEELTLEHAERERMSSQLRERQELLENEVESLAAELLESGQRVRAQTERIEARERELEQALEDARSEIQRLHGEVASRQRLITSMEASRIWRFRRRLRRAAGRVG